MSDNLSPAPGWEAGLDDDDFEEDNIEESFLTFAVQESEYALCLANVIEIVVGQRIIEMPDVPDYIKGVINLRGKVIPVMDLRTRFGAPFREYGPRSSIVVVEVDGESMGLAVDEVKDVVQIPAGQVSPPPNYRPKSSGARVIAGVGRREEGVSIILDGPRLLSSAELELEGVHRAAEDLGVSASA